MLIVKLLLFQNVSYLVTNSNLNFIHFLNSQTNHMKTKSAQTTWELSFLFTRQHIKKNKEFKHLALLVILIHFRFIHLSVFKLRCKILYLRSLKLCFRYLRQRFLDISFHSKSIVVIGNVERLLLEFALILCFLFHLAGFVDFEICF